MSIGTQILWLFILAIPIACVSWTVTHEELFKEFHDFCRWKSVSKKGILLRKFFYMFTCEFCFSHYVTAFFLIITRYQLLLLGWRGYLIAGFALVFIANIYMSAFALIRVDIKLERADAEIKEEEVKKITGA
jgi:hypothetical protein